MDIKEGIVLVSACLAGVPCNFKGEAKPNATVVKLVAQGKAITVCPECLGGLSIPRAAAERSGNMVFTKYGFDLTKNFNAGAVLALRMAKENNSQLAILKARSPSCGVGKIYDGTFSGKLVDGNGVAAELLMKNGIEVITEEDLG